MAGCTLPTGFAKQTTSLSARSSHSFGGKVAPRARTVSGRVAERKMLISMGPNKVAVMMGSPNDLDKMRKASDMLKKFGLEPVVKVMSAHRQPAEVAEFASAGREDGYAAFICGAGMAAHLAGVVSAHTTLPVVGVPLSGGLPGGIDALYATVQMPRGIPVATVAVDGAANAAILVAQMLSITDPSLAVQIEAMREETRATLRETNANLDV